MTAASVARESASSPGASSSAAIVTVDHLRKTYGPGAGDAAMQGHFPPTRPLLVMTAYAVVFGIAAIRLFRWE